VVAEENLGLLHDPAIPVFDALRDPGAIPPAVRAALTDPTPLTVVKANMRSTVHRPQHADVVATRIFDAGGRVTGGRIFLGLFAATPTTATRAPSRCCAARWTASWKWPGSRPTAMTAARCATSSTPGRATSCSRPRNPSSWKARAARWT